MGGGDGGGWVCARVGGWFVGNGNVEAKSPPPPVVVAVAVAAGLWICANHDNEMGRQR
jgi:hypothetical protein